MAIPVKQYPAAQRFDAFNAVLFDGQLPKIPIQFYNLKTAGGVCKARRVRATQQLVPGSLLIQLSSRYLRTPDQFDGVLVHEMIHAYMYVTGHMDENHGRLFQAKLTELQSRVKFTIPLTDDTKDLDLKDSKPKTYVVLVLPPTTPVDQGRRSYALLSDSVLGHANDMAIASLRRNNPGLVVYKITTPEWTRFAAVKTVQRNIYKVKFYYENERTTPLLNQLEAQGEVLPFDKVKIISQVDIDQWRKTPWQRLADEVRNFVKHVGFENKPVAPGVALSFTDPVDHLTPNLLSIIDADMKALGLTRTDDEAKGIIGWHARDVNFMVLLLRKPDHAALLFIDPSKLQRD